MEMEKICIELPIVRIEQSSPIFSSDFAKEHYEVGLFITDDGVIRHMMYYDGIYVNAFPCPHDVIERRLVEKVQMDLDEIYHRDMEELEERLCRIESKIQECRDTCDGVNNNLVEVRDDLIDTIDEKFSGLSRSGEGVNILDVAKSFAVIQKPELIKELSK